MRVDVAFVGVEMEAYGDQAAVASSYKSKEEPSRKLCNYQHRVVEIARLDRG